MATLWTRFRRTNLETHMATTRKYLFQTTLGCNDCFQEPRKLLKMFCGKCLSPFASRSSSPPNAPSATPGTDSATAVEEETPSSSTTRRKTARQALTDRASRGLSLMSSFKSRQEKAGAKGGLAAQVGRPEGSPVPAASSNRGTARAVSSSAKTPTGSPEGRDGAMGSHLTKLVLKFTTASESDVQPSCEINTSGASIGQSELNTVSIPSDTMLAPLNHAIVSYMRGRAGNSATAAATTGATGSSSGNGGRGSRDEVEAEGVDCEAASSEGASSAGVEDGAGGGGDEGAGGAEGFYFCDGGQDTDFAAALRLRVGAGNRDWPLTEGCYFSAGLTVFRAHRVRPPGDVVKVVANATVGGETGAGDEAGGGGADAKHRQNGADGDKDKDDTGRVVTTEEVTVSGCCLWLEATAGCLKGRTWEVGAVGATLGRAGDNNLSLADKEMSRRHSKIEYHEVSDEFYLCDLGSLNGTYMQMIGPYSARRLLCLGDHLLVGRTGFSVNRYDYGISERMGARPSMEDKSTVIQDLDVSSLAGSLLWPQTFAGVYDGHGGGEASEYLWANLHLKVSASLAARSKRLLEAAAAGCGGRSPQGKGQSLLARAVMRRKPFSGGGSTGEGGGAGGGGGAGAVGGGGGRSSGGGGGWEALDAVVREAINEAFAAADREFIATSRLPEAGSTATTCLVLGPRLYIANVGDSRTVLCRGGKLRMASLDHKPCRVDEQERVHKAGGFIAHRRVMGELAVSRAFGDSEFKVKANGEGWSNNDREGRESGEDSATQLVTAEPEFLISEIMGQDQFVALACDGIFDVMTSEEVVSDVFEKMKIHGDTQRCCEDLTERAIVERRTRDNVSLVVLIFNRWY